jgi:hypothetical protein
MHQGTNTTNTFNESVSVANGNDFTLTIVCQSVGYSYCTNVINIKASLKKKEKERRKVSGVS